MITILDVKHLYGTRNQNCKIHNSTIPGGATDRVKYAKGQLFKNLLLYCHLVRKK